MNIKTIAIAILAGYGIWYTAVGGRQLDERKVSALYGELYSAYAKEDEKAICALYGDELAGGFTSRVRSPLVYADFTKAQACASSGDFFRLKQQLETATGKTLYANVDLSIKSISISSDKKTATVDVLVEKRIGTPQELLFDMRATQTDVVQRDFGKAFFTRSEGTVNFYKSRP